MFARLAILAFMAAAPLGWLADLALAPEAEAVGVEAAEVPALTVEPRRPGVALFYFFSPDWRPPDLGKLTVAVETALASGDVDVSFQAFNRYEDFERQVLLQPPVLMIAPAWVEGSQGNSLGLERTVIARPVRRGKDNYRKALMTRSNLDSIGDLARGSIAATLHSMGSGDPAAVLDSFHLAADSARIVPVPKDVDALLALNFGQVDAALVTSEQYEVLARTNPAEAEQMRVLAFSNQVGLPPVFASAGADAAMLDRLRDLLERLREVPQGTNVLTMLGFDGFVAERPAEFHSETPTPGIANGAPTPGNTPAGSREER
ncbi:MAG: PhnD/SsuA/transferrin family substrate-binding protein [Candidatus Binatia bacterium]